MDIDFEEVPAHIQERGNEIFDPIEEPVDLQNYIENAHVGRHDSRRMLAKLRSVSGIRTTDNVEERRETERMRRDHMVREALGTVSGDPPIPTTSRKKNYSSNIRCLAEMLDAGPEAVSWNAITARLPRRVLISKIRKAQLGLDPANDWNKIVRDLEPRAPSCRRHGTASSYMDPMAPQHDYQLGTQPIAKQSLNDIATDWMRRAEAGKLSNRITRCELTGQTLIDRGIRGGLSYWMLTKDFNGMGLDAAREMVNAAAILSGIMPGQINGSIPDIAKKLAQEPDAWCGIAIATRHPIFYKVAQAMTKLRNTVYWNTKETDMRNNLQAWARAVDEINKSGS